MSAPCRPDARPRHNKETVRVTPSLCRSIVRLPGVAETYCVPDTVYTLFTCVRGRFSRFDSLPPAPSTTAAYESCAIRTINDDSRPNGEKNIVRVSRIKSQSPSKLVFIELLASKPISIYFKMELTPSPNEAVETSLN